MLEHMDLRQLKFIKVVDYKAMNKTSVFNTDLVLRRLMVMSSAARKMDALRQ